MAKMRLSQVAESRRVAMLGACVATCVAAAATETSTAAPLPLFSSPFAVYLSLSTWHFSSIFMQRHTLQLSSGTLPSLSLSLPHPSHSASLWPSPSLSSQLQFKRTFFLATHFPRHMHKQFFQLPFVPLLLLLLVQRALFATLGACHITTTPAATEVATATYATAAATATAASAMQRCMTH